MAAYQNGLAISSVPAPVVPQRLSGLQAHFLARLGRLTAMSETTMAAFGDAAVRRRLLNHAIYSTWRDCLAAGAGEEARSFLSARLGAAAAP